MPERPPPRQSPDWTGFGRGGSKYTGLINSALLAVAGVALLPVEVKGFPPSSILLVIGLLGLAINAFSLWRGRLSRKEP